MSSNVGSVRNSAAPIHLKNVRVEAVKFFRREMAVGKPVLEISYTYFNHMPYPVYIVDRSGLVTKLPVTRYNAPGADGITILKKYRFSQDVIFDLSYLNKSGLAEAEQKAFKEAYDSRVQDPHTTDMWECSTKHCIPGGGIVHNDVKYYPAFGLLICLERPNDTVHPDWLRGKLSELAFKNGICYDLIVSSHTGDKVYAWSNGKVQGILARVDEAVEQGLWITHYEHGMVLEATQYTIEEAIEQQLIFATHQEALNHGSPEVRVLKDIDYLKDQSKLGLLREEQRVKELSLEEKAITSSTKIDQIKLETTKDQADNVFAVELAKMKHEQLVREHAAQAAKYESDQRARALEHELKAQGLRQELELKSIHQSYEMRSMDRKDSSEMMKWAPALVVAGVGLWKILG